MCFHCLLAFLSLKNVRYFKKSTILIYSIHMYAIEVNEMNELVCVSVFNPVTFSEAYPDIDHYKVCLFSNQCSNLFQTSAFGRQLAPESQIFFYTEHLTLSPLFLPWNGFNHQVKRRSSAPSCHIIRSKSYAILKSFLQLTRCYQNAK